MVTDLNNDTEQNPLSEKRVSKRTVNFLGKEKQGDKCISNPLFLESINKEFTEYTKTKIENCLNLNKYQNQFRLYCL